MICVPTQELSQLRKRMQEWESWLGSLLRLASAQASLGLAPAMQDECDILHNRIKQAQEMTEEMLGRLSQADELMEESDVLVGRALNQLFSEFSMPFDTSCLESLHLAGVENDVSRLTLGGAVSRHVLPGVTSLQWQAGEEDVADGL